MPHGVIGIAPYFRSHSASVFMPPCFSSKSKTTKPSMETPTLADGILNHWRIVSASSVASFSPCGTALPQGCFPGRQPFMPPHKHLPSLIPQRGYTLKPSEAYRKAWDRFSPSGVLLYCIEVIAFLKCEGGFACWLTRPLGLTNYGTNIALTTCVLLVGLPFLSVLLPIVSRYLRPTYGDNLMASFGVNCRPTIKLHTAT